MILSLIIIAFFLNVIIGVYEVFHNKKVPRHLSRFNMPLGWIIIGSLLLMPREITTILALARVILLIWILLKMYDDDDRWYRREAKGLPEKLQRLFAPYKPKPSAVPR